MSKSERTHTLLIRLSENEALLRNSRYGQNEAIRIREVFDGFYINEIEVAMDIFHNKILWNQFIFTLVYSNDSL